MLIELSYFLKDLRAIKSIYDLGITHGDIKGDNLFSFREQVKIIDFRLSDSIIFTLDENNSSVLFSGQTFLGQKNSE